MIGHNICLKGVIWKIIPKLSLLSQLPGLIWSTGILIIALSSVVSGKMLRVRLFKNREKSGHKLDSNPQKLDY